MRNLTNGQLEDFDNRLDLIQEDETDIIAFPEIQLTKEQIGIIADKFFGIAEDEQYNYCKGKIHKQLLLSSGVYVTREDQPEFQYLVDLGIKALKSGMRLIEPKAEQTQITSKFRTKEENEKIRTQKKCTYPNQDLIEFQCAEFSSCDDCISYKGPISKHLNQ